MEDHEARIAALEAQLDEVQRKLGIGKYDTALVQAARRANQAMRRWLNRGDGGPPRTIEHFDLTTAHYERKLADYLGRRAGG